MTSYVMIHGGAHGGWCWERMAKHLDGPMLAIDLPGRGEHPAPLDAQSWASFVASAEQDIRDWGADNIVLVAHSMGGITAVGLMEQMADRIRHVVFVACPIPVEGLSIGQNMKRNLQSSEERMEGHRGFETGNPNASLADMLFHDLAEADRTYCTEHMVPESTAVFNEPVSLAGLTSDIPRTYITTTNDHALVPELQAQSIARIPDCSVVPIDTGHTPMFAAPAELAQIIVEASAR